MIANPLTRPAAAGWGAALAARLPPRRGHPGCPRLASRRGGGREQDPGAVGAKEQCFWRAARAATASAGGARAAIPRYR